jgi:hypothetical protein
MLRRRAFSLLGSASVKCDSLAERRCESLELASEGELCESPPLRPHTVSAHYATHIVGREEWNTNKRMTPAGIAESPRWTNLLVLK